MHTGVRERDWSKPVELAQGLQLPWGLRIHFSEPSFAFINNASSITFLLARRIWGHSQEELEEHGFRHLDTQNYIHHPNALTLSNCGFHPSVASFGHCTRIRDPICLNSMTQVSYHTTVFQTAFSWRVSVSSYCSPHVLGSLFPIWITSDYFLPIFLISVCFCIAFPPSLELSTPPSFASSKHFVKSIISIY